MTSRVIQETMRVASILSFTFREAVEDVEYQGEGGLQLASYSFLARRWSAAASLSCAPKGQ
jgi:hypothetical protein